MLTLTQTLITVYQYNSHMWEWEVLDILELLPDASTHVHRRRVMFTRSTQTVIDRSAS